MSILKSGFHPGKPGIAGPGMYFAEKPEVTAWKAQHFGCMIRATVRIGKTLKLPFEADRSLTGEKLLKRGYDSVWIPRGIPHGTAPETVVYFGDQIVQLEAFPCNRNGKTNFAHSYGASGVKTQESAGTLALKLAAPDGIDEDEAEDHGIRKRDTTAWLEEDSGLAASNPKQMQQLDLSSASAGDFFAKLQVVPYGVLGSQLTAAGKIVTKQSAPDGKTAVVDPAGLPYVKTYGPSMAGGASGVLYRWLSIGNDQTFPDDVRNSLTAELLAKYHKYGDKIAIHAIGPDFRSGPYTYSATAPATALATVYRNIFAEFAHVDHGVTSLRLLPVSGGIFSGKYLKELPTMTARALAAGFDQSTPEVREKLMSAKSLQLCIFNENDYDRYSQAVAHEAHQVSPLV